MDKLLKRTAQAEKQVARRAAAHMKRQLGKQRAMARITEREANVEIRKNKEDARQALLDEWEMGPLAPKRDLGFNEHGIMSAYMRRDFTAQGRRDLKKDLLEKRFRWAGGERTLCITPGDRVVLYEGPDKGKIDRIKEIDMESGTVQLEKCHQAMIASPLNMDAQGVAMPLPVDAVRLVYPVPDPETGIPRDVVINELRAAPADMNSPHMSFERWEHGIRYDRFVPGLNVVIPWPDVEVPEYTTHNGDTPRQQVEERTYYYNLLSPPMPSAVLRELRNPYSRFRTRHEPEYIARKEAEAAAKKARGQLVQSMMTPLDDFHAAKKAKKIAQGEPELTDDMLQKLGELMSRRTPVSETTPPES